MDDEARHAAEMMRVLAPLLARGVRGEGLSAFVVPNRGVTTMTQRPDLR